MPTVTLKISDDEKALWVESAQHAGVSLSEWIRRRCQGRPVTNAVITVTELLENPARPVREALDAATLGDPEGVSVHDPEVIRAALPRHPGMVKTDFKQGKKK